MEVELEPGEEEEEEVADVAEGHATTGWRLLNKRICRMRVGQ